MLSQLQVINKILNTKDYSIVSKNNLSEKLFYNYKAEFRFIKSHFEQYNTIPDKTTFKNTFTEFEFLDVNEPDSYLLEELYKDYNSSYLASSFNRMKELLEAGKIDEAKEWYAKGIENLHNSTVFTCVDLISDTSRYDHYLDRTVDQTKYYISTGFEELDRIIGGIDLENENLVIAARPGVGKTQIMVKMAVAAALQGKNIGIYEGEMTEDKIGYRIDTFLGHIKNSAINRGDISVNTEYKKYIENLKLRNIGKIKVLTPSMISGEPTVGVLRSFIEQEHLDMLFVDQYSLLEDRHSAKADHEHVGNIAKDIKKLQVEKKIPIVAVSQMNRTVVEDSNKNKTQDTSQVAGSDKISQYATVLIMLEQKVIEDELHRKSLQLTLNIVKARDGGDHNKLVYTTDFNYGILNYVPSEQDGVTTQEELEKVFDKYQVRDESGEVTF